MIIYSDEALSSSALLFLYVWFTHIEDVSVDLFIYTFTEEPLHLIQTLFYC